MRQLAAAAVSIYGSDERKQEAALTCYRNPLPGTIFDTC